jgi:hypothetical protein
MSNVSEDDGAGNGLSEQAETKLHKRCWPEAPWNDPNFDGPDDGESRARLHKWLDDVLRGELLYGVIEDLEDARRNIIDGVPLPLDHALDVMNTIYQLKDDLLTR